jgi:hypothetical protein
MSMFGNEGDAENAPSLRYIDYIFINHVRSMVLESPRCICERKKTIKFGTDIARRGHGIKVHHDLFE